RLVRDKKPLLALEGFRLVCDQLGQDARLVFVGDGPLRNELEEARMRAGLAHCVEILGHVGTYNDLRAQYGTVVASLASGYVGLSLIQSLSFGVPMAIACSEPHAPEIEAAREGYNCVVFESDNPEALGTTLLAIARAR